MLRDLRYACRILVKTPGFTIIAVLALALGIGASTTTFSAINALLLRPLPLMKNQDRILYVSQSFTKTQDVGVSFPDYLDFKKQISTLEGIGICDSTTFIMAGADKPERYLGAHISADAFSFLGVMPILGRTFRPGEDDFNAEPVALISHALWQNHFGSDRSVLDKTVLLNGKQTTIIGVMPKGWHFPEAADIWIPLQISLQDFPRELFNFRGFGRLKPGVSLGQARAELETIARRIAAEHPDTHAGASVHVRLFREEAVKDLKTLTLLVMGAVGFVYLIACANVANLLLARGATRAKEIGIRLALGASCRQIVRQLLAESFVLGLAGSALGLLFAGWGVDMMLKAIPVQVPYWVRFDFDWRVFAFAPALGLIGSLVCGLFPALQAPRSHLVDVLKEGGGRSGLGGGKGQRVRNGLVVAEVALALILSIGAGLMLRSFLNLQSTDIGVDPSNTLTFRVGLPPSQFEPQDAARFFSALMPEFAKIPGVESAGATWSLPVAGNTRVGALILEGEPEPKELQNARLCRAIGTTPGYLRTCRIPVMRGRDFAMSDNKDAARVVLIDENGVRLWFPNVDPIGRQLRLVDKPGDSPKWATIVGVVRNVIYDRLASRRDIPCVYTSQFQSPDWFLSVVLRTKSDPNTFADLARKAVASVNKEIPIYKVLTMDEIVSQSFWERRFFGSLFAIFATLALFLASLGLYGVTAYSVRQRTQEIGVRMALGAQTSDVMRMVTGQGLRLILIGLGIGFVGAYFLTKLLAGSLHGVSAHDPLSFIVVPAILLAVGLVACYLPARAAMRLDPMDALRYE
jgi:putative ABC transport system permease protein